MSGADPRKQAEEAQVWIEKADEDVGVVIRLLVDPPFLGSAAYHCQQAAEKLMKALLLARGGRFPKTHDLEDLARRLEVTNPELEPLILPLRGLTDWGAAFRYPTIGPSGSEPPPDRAEIEAALRQIAALRAAVVALTG